MFKTDFAGRPWITVVLIFLSCFLKRNRKAVRSQLSPTSTKALIHARLFRARLSVKAHRTSLPLDAFVGLALRRKAPASCVPSAERSGTAMNHVSDRIGMYTRKTVLQTNKVHKSKTAVAIEWTVPCLP